MENSVNNSIDSLSSIIDDIKPLIGKKDNNLINKEKYPDVDSRTYHVEQKTKDKFQVILANCGQH